MRRHAKQFACLRLHSPDKEKPTVPCGCVCEVPCIADQPNLHALKGRSLIRNSKSIWFMWNLDELALHRRRANLIANRKRHKSTQRVSGAHPFHHSVIQLGLVLFHHLLEKDTAQIAFQARASDFNPGGSQAPHSCAPTLSHKVAWKQTTADAQCASRHSQFPQFAPRAHRYDRWMIETYIKYHRQAPKRCCT